MCSSFSCDTLVLYYKRLLKEKIYFFSKYLQQYLTKSFNLMYNYNQAVAVTRMSPGSRTLDAVGIAAAGNHSRFVGHPSNRFHHFGCHRFIGCMRKRHFTTFTGSSRPSAGSTAPAPCDVTARLPTEENTDFGLTKYGYLAFNALSRSRKWQISSDRLWATSAMWPTGRITILWGSTSSSETINIGSRESSRRVGLHGQFWFPRFDNLFLFVKL